MSEKEVITLVLEETHATRKYPFNRRTLDQIKELRAKQENELKVETGKDHMVPAPVILAQAVEHYHNQTFKE